MIFEELKFRENLRVQRCYFPQNFNQGDVNLDSLINVLDVVYLMNYILNIIDFNENQIMVADMNNDNIINVIDIVLLVEEIVS